MNEIDWTKPIELYWRDGCVYPTTVLNDDPDDSSKIYVKYSSNSAIPFNKDTGLTNAVGGPKVRNVKPKLIKKTMYKRIVRLKLGDECGIAVATKLYDTIDETLSSKDAIGYTEVETFQYEGV